MSSLENTGRSRVIGEAKIVLDSIGHRDSSFYDGPLKPHLEKYFGLFHERLLVGESKYVRSPFFPKWQQRFKEFETRPTDVWVVTYPKAGTTWTQEIVWCLLNDIDSKESKNVLMKRFPFFEWDSLMPEDPALVPQVEDGNPCKVGETWRLIQTMDDPRMIKTHLHLELLPDGIWTSKCKVIYVCRDPRDVVVSYYYHSVKLLGFNGEFSDYLKIFINDLSFCSPFWKHILDFWDRRDEKNILFIRYEELQEDTPRMIKKIADFLGKQVSEDYLQKIADHVTFTSMKANPAVNNESIYAYENERSKNIKFMRKGKVGDWRTHFSDEETHQIQSWTQNELKNSDFPHYRDYE